MIQSVSQLLYLLQAQAISSFFSQFYCRIRVKSLILPQGLLATAMRLRYRCELASSINSVPLDFLQVLERETGIEPATSSLGSWHSTAELLPLRCGELVDKTYGIRSSLSMRLTA